MTGITIEHNQIIRWTQNRGGTPAIEKAGDEYRPVINFPHTTEIIPVSWDEWLATFERGRWAFIYQDRTPVGVRSRKWETVPRFAPAPAPVEE